MGNTPTLEQEKDAHAGDPNAAQKGAEDLEAERHHLTHDSASGVNSQSSGQGQDSGAALGFLSGALAGKKWSLFGWTLGPNGLLDLTNDIFTRNIADSIANPPAQPPKLTDGRQVSTFENRGKQFNEIEKGPPISASVDSGEARDAIIGAAKDHKIDPNALLTLSYIESRWKSNAYNSSSGASGLFQFVPSTARAMGVSDAFDVRQSSEKGAELWNINREGLAHGLGRDATFGETYLAHQQGVGGAVALLNHRDMLAVDALMTTKAYSGRRWLAEKAVVQNGGDVSMSAGEFADKWINHYDRVYSQVQVAKLDNGFNSTEASTHNPNYKGILGGGPAAHSGHSISDLGSEMTAAIKQVKSIYNQVFGPPSNS